jgi:hypothetical protein
MHCMVVQVPLSIGRKRTRKASFCTRLHFPAFVVKSSSSSSSFKHKLAVVISKHFWITKVVFGWMYRGEWDGSS